MIRPLAEIRDNSFLWFGRWAETSGIVGDEVQDVITALSEARQGLVEDMARPAYIAAAMAAVAKAGTLVDRIMRSEGAAGAGLLSLRYGLDRIVERSRAITGGYSAADAEPPAPSP